MDDLTRILNQLDADAKHDISQVDEEFQLTPPEGWDNDEDSLGDQTTNASSIEIEIVEAVADAMHRLDGGRVRFDNVPPGAENFEKRWS